jgi:hypothetical protein
MIALDGLNPSMEPREIYDQITTKYWCPAPAALLQNDTLFWSAYSPQDAPEVLFYLKLLSTSILGIYKVFEHIDMLHIGMIQQQPSSVILTLLRSDFGVLGYLWSQNDVITSRLRLTATSNCFPHPY